jgi:hypothetical protein
MVGVKVADTVQPAASTAVPAADDSVLHSGQGSLNASIKTGLRPADAVAQPETKASGSATPAAPVPASADQTAQLSLGAWIGIGASCLVGISALVAIAYNIWKWKHKLSLLAAKSGGQTSARAGSGSSKPFIV